MRFSEKVSIRGLWITGTALVIAGSLLPGNSKALEVIGSFHVSDKFLHFAGYMVVAWLMALSESRPANLVGCGLLVVMGVGLEFAQRLVPGKRPVLAV